MNLLYIEYYFSYFNTFNKSKFGLKKSSKLYGYCFKTFIVFLGALLSSMKFSSSSTRS